MKIRNANFTDSKDILSWRNNITTRMMSRNEGFINKAEHNNWFKSALSNENCFLYIGIKNNIKIGIVRFDYNFNTKVSDVAINLNPKIRGQGMSFDFLRLSIQKTSYLNILSFIASIKESNNLSKKIFKKCGFKYKYNDSGFDFFIFSNK